MRSAIRMCWISLAATGFISAILIGIAEDTRETGFPFRIDLIPWPILFFAAMFYAIEHANEDGWKTAVGWGFAAIAVLLFMFWNPPVPEPYFHLPRHVRLIMDLVLLAAVAVYFYRKWRDDIRRTVDRAKWRFWRFFGESSSVLTNYFPLKESRDEDAKDDPRLAHLTLRQYAVWARAWADAAGGRLEAQSTNFGDKLKADAFGKQKAWERLYDRWPELRGKV